MSDYTTATTKQGSVWEDLLEVLWAPATVFDRSRSRGVGMYLLVLSGLFIVVLLATQGLLQPYMDANYDLQVIKMAEQGQKLPAEAVAQGRKFAGYFLLVTWGFTAVFSGLFGGITTWLGAKVAGAAIPMGRAIFIATLASVPRLVSLLATAVQGAVLDTSNVKSLFDASIGPARFVDAVSTSPAVLAVLASLDLFTLWNVLITAVGVSVLARVSRGTGWLASFIALGVTLLFTLVPAALA